MLRDIEECFAHIQAKDRPKDEKPGDHRKDELSEHLNIHDQPVESAFRAQKPREEKARQRPQKAYQKRR